MTFITLGAVETRFAEIIWENEPLPSGGLVALCADRLGWKKSTTYTVLKKLCGKGLFKNDNGVVSSLISKEEYFSMQSERFIDDTFKGSLPAFIAAFAARKPLSQDEVRQIQKMINGYSQK
ncbi:MAG: BlaI/MecI/CopY family transcriptional regulator [Clostridia bacterium]|nr:BlaI/MecI/CopY family transcriptional regulator [Clostridia bacterium]